MIGPKHFLSYIITFKLRGVPFRSVPIFANIILIIPFYYSTSEPALWDSPERQIQAFYFPPPVAGRGAAVSHTAVSWPLSMDHTALFRDWPLPAPPSSFPSLSDFYSVLHSFQNPEFFHALVSLLMLFPIPRLPFPIFFARTPMAHSLRLCIDSIASRKWPLLPPPPWALFALRASLYSTFSLCWNSLCPSHLCFVQGEVTTCSSMRVSPVILCSVLLRGGLRGWSPAELSWEHCVLLS